MDTQQIRTILEQVAAGGKSVDDALLALRLEPFTDLGFAKLDSHRALRQGAGEVIYGAGKTPEQIAAIAGRDAGSRGQKTALITRLSPEAAAIGDENSAAAIPRDRAASASRARCRSPCAPRAKIVDRSRAAQATCPWPRRPR
jgi:NCAIR mutase (PurE)-related protein